MSAPVDGIASGVEWALGAAAVTLLGFLLRNTFVTAVNKAIEPLYTRLREHLQEEEEELRQIHSRISNSDERHRLEHEELRRAIDRRNGK